MPAPPEFGSGSCAPKATTRANPAKRLGPTAAAPTKQWRRRARRATPPQRQRRNENAATRPPSWGLRGAGRPLRGVGEHASGVSVAAGRETIQVGTRNLDCVFVFAGAFEHHHL